MRIAMCVLAVSLIVPPVYGAVVDNKVVISETVKSSFTYEDLTAKIENLKGEQKRLNESITAQQDALAVVNDELAEYEGMLENGVTDGLKKAPETEVI